MNAKFHSSVIFSLPHKLIHFQVLPQLHLSNLLRPVLSSFLELFPLYQHHSFICTRIAFRSHNLKLDATCHRSTFWLHHIILHLVESMFCFQTPIFQGHHSQSLPTSFSVQVFCLLVDFLQHTMRPLLSNYLLPCHLLVWFQSRLS